MDASGDPVGYQPKPQVQMTVEDLLARATEQISFLKQKNSRWEEEYNRVITEFATARAEAMMYKNACYEYDKMIAHLVEDNMKKEAATNAVLKANCRAFHKIYHPKETDKAHEEKMNAWKLKHQLLKEPRIKRKKTRASPSEMVAGSTRGPYLQAEHHPLLPRTPRDRRPRHHPCCSPPKVGLLSL